LPGFFPPEECGWAHEDRGIALFCAGSLSVCFPLRLSCNYDNPSHPTLGKILGGFLLFLCGHERSQKWPSGCSVSDDTSEFSYAPPTNLTLPECLEFLIWLGGFGRLPGFTQAENLLISVNPVLAFRTTWRESSFLHRSRLRMVPALVRLFSVISAHLFFFKTAALFFPLLRAFRSGWHSLADVVLALTPRFRSGFSPFAAFFRS